MNRTFTRGEALSILTHAPADAVKQLADSVLPSLPEVTVLKNRTGLVMLPYTDSAEGAIFHLGEVLVAEGHIRLPDGAEGYGMVMGRDTVLALGIAVLDAARAARVETGRINAFLQAQAAAQDDADDELLRKVEATRVEMETF